MIPFSDRLADSVSERRSQICLGLDPDPAQLSPERAPSAVPDAASSAAAAIAAHCRELIELAGPACVAAKLQLACFERLGAPGWTALAEVADAARQAGLLVIADGKRGDVPITATAYGQALVGEVETPWGTVSGIGADAFTASPLLGPDAIEPLVDAAGDAAAGIFLLVRTSNPGAAQLQDIAAPNAPFHERLAAMVDSHADALIGQCGLSGAGAVVGATEPARLPRLRELMPRAVFLLPGVGAQGGKPEELGPAFTDHPASAMVAVSRSVAEAANPAAAARELQKKVWEAGPG